MTELRWLIKKNLDVTVDTVLMYAERHMCTMNEARARMIDERPPVLQYRDGMGCEWQDVPTVVEQHKE
jgi:hypothetical protein